MTTIRPEVTGRATGGAAANAPRKRTGRVRMTLPDRVLRNAELAKFLGCSDTEISRRQREDPDFPPSFPMGERARGTLLSDAHKYVMEKRDKAAAERALRFAMADAAATEDATDDLDLIA